MPNLDFSSAKFYAEKIMVLENSLSKEECDWLIDAHKNLDLEIKDDSQVIKKLGSWQTSSIDHPHVYGTKREAMNAGNSFENSTEKVKEVYSYLRNLFHSVGEFYHKEIGLEYDPATWTDFATFHYVNGQEMGPHVDYDGEPELAPIATVLLYLNSDKKGGDLYFKDQDVLVESKAGTLVVFPCVKPFYHQSTLITEGEKYHVGSAWKRSIQ